jgi:sulfur-carrier protein
MQLNILLFAGAKQAAGCNQVSIESSLPLQVSELKAILASHYPSLEPFVRYSRIAYGQEFVDDTYVLDREPIREIALIPPVSGG